MHFESISRHYVPDNEHFLKYWRLILNTGIYRFSSAPRPILPLEQSTAEDIIWLKVNKSLTHSPQDVYLCCTYISQKMSCRNMENNDSQLKHIYNDTLKYKFMGNVCLMGDFNCRTGNLHEYTQNENDYILDMSNINYLNHTIDYIIDNNQNVHKARVTVDTKVNPYGKELINICRINYLYILNRKISWMRFFTIYGIKNCQIYIYNK